MEWIFSIWLYFNPQVPEIRQSKPAATHAECMAQRMITLLELVEDPETPNHFTVTQCIPTIKV